jgi:hypothetical protein
MRHSIDWHAADSPLTGGRFGYQWFDEGRWCELCATTHGPLGDLKSESLAEFIVEHYWGYSARADGTTLEYAVEHAPWRVWEANSYSLSANIRALYGERFVQTLSSVCHSALVAEGSPVAVYGGRVIT